MNNQSAGEDSEVNAHGKAPKNETPCDQCGLRPSMTIVDWQGRSHALCLSCWKEFSAIMDDLYERNMRALNYEAAIMDDMSGMPSGFTPRHQLPARRYQTIIGDYTLTNIKLDRSAVGVINTGTVAGSLENIDASIEILKEDPGYKELYEGMRKISEAVMNASDVAECQKVEILELLSALSDEIRVVTARRRPSAIKSLLTGISTTTEGIASIAKVWELVKPVFDFLLR